MARGPVEVEAACESAVVALTGAFDPSQVTGSRAQWAGVVASAQRVIDTACAVQDAAIARLASVEPELVEDGTVVECHRALGHVALDAPAVVSGVLSVSAVHAERRVLLAVRLAADGPAGTPTDTGLGGLHSAMAAGRLDAYRAGVIAEELEHAPSQVAAAVVAAVEKFFQGEDAAHLRRRCRRVLSRISPDLLHQRAARARARCGLRRWVDEPGVDRWEGTFPSEDAAQAWAAIDALARRYVQEQACATIEAARAKALTDLVAGHATVATVLTVTVPAQALPQTAPTGEATNAAGREVGEDDLAEVTGPSAGEPVLVSRQWLADAVGSGCAVQVAPCHRVTGALLDGTAAVPENPVTRVADAAAGSGADRYRPCTRLAALVRARDRRCRFPGCTVAAVFCDLDHVRPWPDGPTREENLICLCRRHHRIKQRTGWRATVTPDAVVTWIDPTGRVRTTAPVDALHTTILTGTPEHAAPVAPSTSRPRTPLPDGPHTELEFRLEHLGAPPARPPRARSTASGPVTVWRDDRGRHRTDLSAPSATITLNADAWPHQRARHPRPCHDTDPPPF